MEDDAEIALLHSMQQQAAWDGVGEAGDGADDAGDAEIPTNSDQEEKEPFVADPVLRAVSPDGDSYDPLSNSLPAHVSGEAESRSSSSASARKPKTIGGFADDDSDDEEPQITISNLQVPPTRSISRSPLHMSATPEAANTSSVTDSIVAAVRGTSNTDSDYNPPPAQVLAQRAPDQAASVSATSTAPYAPITSSIIDERSTAVHVPKARLPHDRVGILEDRIAEDPRGDLEAWLSLISEHRNRNKLDDARAVYDRFFKVFPSAVS